MRREENHVGRRVMNMEVQDRRRRGGPKRRWIDCVREDLEEKGLTGELAQDRGEWRKLVRNNDPV